MMGRLPVRYATVARATSAYNRICGPLEAEWMELSAAGQGDTPEAIELERRIRGSRALLSAYLAKAGVSSADRDALVGAADDARQGEQIAAIVIATVREVIVSHLAAGAAATVLARMAR